MKCDILIFIMRLLKDKVGIRMAVPKSAQTKFVGIITYTMHSIPVTRHLIIIC